MSEFQNQTLFVEDNVSVDEVRQRVVATGVALLFTYCVNFAMQAGITFGYKKEDRSLVMAKLVETSRVLYWFGAATFFSIYPPYYYGVHCAILAWVTFLVVVILHLACLIEKKIKDRSIWSMVYWIYHFLIFVWILVTLIMGYVWSSRAERR